MAIYDESLVPTEHREEDFAGILTALLDPLSQMCVLGAASLPTIENAIYTINCLLHIQVSLVNVSLDLVKTNAGHSVRIIYIPIHEQAGGCD